MRLLVHAATLDEADARMVHASAALAGRGHQVLWLDGDGGEGALAAPMPGVHRISGVLDLVRGSAPRADVVLGAGRSPVRTAVAGWLSGARAMGLHLGAHPASAWGVLGRWCWESLDGFAMSEAGDGPEGAPAGIVPERSHRWSDEPLTAEPEPDHPDCEILERACERWLARRDGPPSGAAFIDRDGTLVVERGYLADADEIELLPGVPQALRALRAAGLRLVVVSNQSGVGRGFFPKRRVLEAMARLREALRSHGIELDAIYFCPHRPEHGCNCRKPGTELLEQAAQNLNLSLVHSVMIGDKLLDAATGQNAGGEGVLVRTGYGNDEASRLPDPDFPKPPDYVAEHLVDAARWILSDR